MFWMEYYNIIVYNKSPLDPDEMQHIISVLQQLESLKNQCYSLENP